MTDCAQCGTNADSEQLRVLCTDCFVEEYHLHRGGQ